MYKTFKNVFVTTVAVAFVTEVFVRSEAFVTPSARIGIPRVYVSSLSEPDEIFSEASIASSKTSTFTPSPIENVSASMTTSMDDFGVPIPPNCDEGDTSDECVIGSEEFLGECLPERLVTLPRHTTSEKVERLLRTTERILRTMHINSTDIAMSQIVAAKEAGRAHERIYANNYVDLGKIDT
jgi:hypothetical protein